MSRVTDILKKLDGLNSGELQQISEKLLKLLQEVNGVFGVPSAPVDQCRKCGDKHIVKFGKDKNGNQRYRCKACGATFTVASYSALSNTHCSMDVWEKYISLLLKGCTLNECAMQCHISVRTAFIWRHKILNALQRDQDNRIMAGIIEADEMYLPVSYKGNHKNSKRFAMPRKAFQRGSDNRSNNFPKVCVMCAVERNGQSYGEALGQGQPTIKKVTYAFENRIAPDSIMLSDRTRGMKSYFSKKADVQLIQLKASVAGKKHGGAPEVRGIYHIQTVNNFHNRLQRFLRPYNGVSTKYLNHYISLFVWLENYKRVTQQNLVEDTGKYISQKDMYVCSYDLFAMPPIPNPCAA